MSHSNAKIANKRSSPAWFVTVHEVFISLSDNFSVVSDSDKRQNLQTPPVSALTPHEGRRYQGIASETLSSKADQQSNIVLG